MSVAIVHISAEFHPSVHEHVKSRRSLISLKESQSTGANQSPTSTPRLLRRSCLHRSSLSRGSSADSQNGSRNNSIVLTEDSIRRHDVNTDLSQTLVVHQDKKLDTST
jgi:hypothetical protein